jgi:hypothetical protein
VPPRKFFRIQPAITPHDRGAVAGFVMTDNRLDRVAGNLARAEFGGF